MVGYLYMRIKNQFLCLISFLQTGRDPQTFHDVHCLIYGDTWVYNGVFVVLSEDQTARMVVGL